MKPIQLEIIVFADTHFSSSLPQRKDDSNGQTNNGEFQELEEASWNGLFHDILPEVYWEPEKTKKLFLWKVIQADHFLQLDYAERPYENDWAFSMNPYFFLRPERFS